MTAIPPRLITCLEELSPDARRRVARAIIDLPKDFFAPMCARVTLVQHECARLAELPDLPHVDRCLLRVWSKTLMAAIELAMYHDFYHCSLGNDFYD